MKTSQLLRKSMTASSIALAMLAMACSGNQGGMSLEQTQRETNTALQKQDTKSAGIERLEGELAQIPAKQQLTKTPYRDTLGPFILERQGGTGPYKFYVAPLADLTTGELPPANTLIVALVDYKKVDDGPYVIVEKNKTIPGFRLDADVTVIDHTIPAVIYKKTFKGEKPSPSLKNSNDLYIKEGDTEIVGKKPFEEIRTFLAELPFRK